MTNKIINEDINRIESYSSSTSLGALEKLKSIPFFGDFDIDIPIMCAIDALKTYYNKYGDIEIEVIRE